MNWINNEQGKLRHSYNKKLTFISFKSNVNSEAVKKIVKLIYVTQEIPFSDSLK